MDSSLLDIDPATLSRAALDSLRLKHHGDPEALRFIDQLDCRRRCLLKLPTIAANPQFLFPSTLSAEQSTSEALAAFHSSLVDTPESNVIDLTAGLGIDAFAMARAGHRVTAVELEAATAAALRRNAQTLGLSVEVVEDDCRRVVAASPLGRYDVAFIDPARRGAHGQRVFDLSSCSPDVVAMLPDIRRISRRLIIKLSPMFDITRLVTQLDGCAERIIVAGTTGECKELVAVCRLDSSIPIPADQVEISCLVATEAAPGAHRELFTFTPASEREAALRDTIVSAIPAPGAWLHIPWPVVAKAGAGATISHLYGVEQLAPSTHLYTSPDVVADFPGRSCKIEAVYTLSRGDIKALRRAYPAVSGVTARNIGLTSAQLRDRLALKDGRGPHIYGVKATRDDRRLLIVASADNAALSTD